MPIFKCKMCGGTLEINESQTTATCEYCGTQQTLPRLDDDRRAQMYDRANHFRRSNEFDKAIGLYEKILAEDNTDAEAYWSLVLCRYGIEYVEDPATRKRVPTVNRAQFTSIFDDENYKSALQYGDGYQKSIYEEEAKTINEIQKGILAISQKENPFDVFICYKETDANGRRTRDSVLANDLYHQLTQEGFKVFFSRITLEDKIGTAYEPYIFAALNSSKVMVVIGTKPEYFNAPWVKNEWSRYLSLVKQSGGKKVLIPAYRDMDPYDLPEEFSHLQAQDMSKLGFMQDLIRGIKKLTGESTPKTVVKEATGSGNIAPLLKRAFMYLEDGEWDNADIYCEKVLDIDPENGMAYLGKLMAEMHVEEIKDLKDCRWPFDDSNNYLKVVRFGDENLVSDLEGYITYINERNEEARLNKIYSNAVEIMESADTEDEYKKAAEIFESVKEYRDAEEKAEQCREKAEIARKDAIYAEASEHAESYSISSLQSAIPLYDSISGYKDANIKAADCRRKLEELQLEEKRRAEEKRLEEKRRAEEKRIAKEKLKRRLIKATKIGESVLAVVVIVAVLLNTLIIPTFHYNKAVSLMESGNYEEAFQAFIKSGDFKDSSKKKDELLELIYNKAVSLMESGNYEEAYQAFIKSGDFKDSSKKKAELLKLIYEKPQHDAVSAGLVHTVGLKSNGTVVATEYKGAKYYSGQCDVSEWKDIVAVSAGADHTVGLKSNGTVVAIGSNNYGQCDVSEWKDIVAVSARYCHTVGLKSNGTVVAVGSNYEGQCDVSEWKDIVAVSAGYYHTVGLKSNGTVVAVGSNYEGQCDVSRWKDIVAVSAGDDYTVGLKSNGTVVAVGNNYDGECNVSEWKDIVAVSAGDYHTVGLKSDGTVVAVGSNYAGKRDVSEWKDIVAVSAGDDHTVGLKSNGTVVAVGNNYDGECNVSEWKDIKTKK